MKMRWIYVILLMFFLSCEEATDWAIEARDQDLLVVEALVTNELKQHTIKLTRTIIDLNITPEPVSGAFVAVRTDNSVARFYEWPQGSGVYYSDSVQAVVNRSYQLYINNNNKEYYATASMVPVTPLKPINYSLVDEENDLYAINFQDSNEPSIKEYWISWSHLPDYQDLPVEETTARSFHYTLSTIDVNQSFKPEQGRVKFPVGSVILRKKYSLSNEHQAFVRSFLIETEWRGSVFDVQKGNVLTNFSDGAIGFFAVSTVVSDTTVVIP